VASRLKLKMPQIVDVPALLAAGLGEEHVVGA
jgi:hypothetical protein